MHLLTDYIQPLTFWLQTHPHFALFITFLISFAESLAIIGSIIPGSITMTAIGILAGSGIMRIDLTFLAAVLGAIAGDSGSYALGYHFSDRLTSIWPFRNYPKWLSYGKDYFARHGATSILLGRFFGPMRSIIPVIAGIMHMNRWHFLLANVISAIGWAILYVLPGVIIGAASTELSSESSTRLFVVILLILIFVWFMSVVVKWFLVHTNHFLRTKLHGFWSWLKEHPTFAVYSKRLAPSHEVNHYPTAALTLIASTCFVLSFITTILVSQDSWIAVINNPAYLFFQSMRTQHLDTLFIIISLIISPLPLFALMLATTIYTLYYREWRTLSYWLALVLTTGTIIFVLTFLVDVPKPNGLLRQHAPLSFPLVNLTLATSLIGFLILYIGSQYHTVSTLILRIALISLLTLGCIAPVYLGDNWIMSIIASCFISLTVCLWYWIFYRRVEQLQKSSQLPLAIVFFLFTLTTCFSYRLDFKNLVQTHSSHLEQYVLTDDAWWNQKRPLLPIYSTNRIGQRTGLLNIQYAGSLSNLQQTLEMHGWKRKTNSIFYSLLMRASGENPSDKLPLLPELYLNKKPTLIMTYSTKNNRNLLVLRLWRSNYHLRHYLQPIWLGSVSLANIKKHQQYSSHQTNPEDYISQALPLFRVKQVSVSKRCIKLLPHRISSTLLIIKEPETQ